MNDIDAIRRSGVMAPLSSDEASRVLEACDRAAPRTGPDRRRAGGSAGVLGQVRKVLNERQAIVG